MTNCECLDGCPFFNDKMSDASGLGAIFKKKCCLGDNAQCARYLISNSRTSPVCRRTSTRTCMIGPS